MMSTSCYVLLACVACACALTSADALGCWECNAPDEFGNCVGVKDPCEGSVAATPNAFCLKVTYPDGRKERACGNKMAANSEDFDFQDGCHNVTSAGTLKDGLYCRCSDKDYCNEGRRGEGLRFDREAKKQIVKREAGESCDDENGAKGILDADGKCNAPDAAAADTAAAAGEKPADKPPPPAAAPTTTVKPEAKGNSTNGTASHRMGAAVTVLLCPAIVMLVL